MLFNKTYLQRPILRLNGDNLIPHQFQYSVHDGLETLQNLLIGKGHVAFLDTGLWEFCLDTNIDGPLLSIVSEIGLDSVLKVHDALCVYLASSS
jgi:hypothetical protein